MISPEKFRHCAICARAGWRRRMEDRGRAHSQHQFIDLAEMYSSEQQTSQSAPHYRRRGWIVVIAVDDDGDNPRLQGSESTFLLYIVLQLNSDFLRVMGLGVIPVQRWLCLSVCHSLSLTNDRRRRRWYFIRITLNWKWPPYSNWYCLSISFIQTRKLREISLSLQTLKLLLEPNWIRWISFNTPNSIKIETNKTTGRRI